MEPSRIAKQAAADFFGASATNAEPVDLTTSKFPWAKRHSFYMAMNAERRKLLISVDEKGVPYPFEPVSDLSQLNRSSSNMIMLNSILSTEGVNLPEGLDLPWTSRNVLMGLGGWVGSGAFFSNEESALHLWTHLSPNDGPRLFRQYCNDPELRRSGEQWDLDFSYFNLRGGVEGWHAHGNQRAILGATGQTVLPDKTFLVPYG